MAYDDDGKSDRFDERGSDRFDEPAPRHEPVVFEPVKEPVLDIDVRCTVCRKEIEGDALQVLGGLYHHACFACNGCGNKVGTDEFFDRGEKKTNVPKNLKKKKTQRQQALLRRLLQEVVLAQVHALLQEHRGSERREFLMFFFFLYC